MITIEELKKLADKIGDKSNELKDLSNSVNSHEESIGLLGESIGLKSAQAAIWVFISEQSLKQLQ